jgi:hypothetical protein
MGMIQNRFDWDQSSEEVNHHAPLDAKHANADEKVFLQRSTELPWLASRAEPSTYQSLRHLYGCNSVADSSPSILFCASAIDRRCDQTAGQSHCWALDIAECHQPIFVDIINYLVQEPADLFRISCTAATLMIHLEPEVNGLWRGLFQSRWPAFYEYLAYSGVRNWQKLYDVMLAGGCQCTLEVFDREKKQGFAMAAMPAQVQYDPCLDAFIATYISASEVVPEIIPVSEEHRLRFCPPSARAQLQPGRCLHTDHQDDADSVCKRADAYPFKVLQGLDALEVGQPVELQWKMQAASPFGWWFGQLEDLSLIKDTSEAMVTISFHHFPTTSRWHRLQVRIGGSQIQPCNFGGFTGGLRRVSDAERKHWMRFFPNKALCF